MLLSRRALFFSSVVTSPTRKVVTTITPQDVKDILLYRHVSNIKQMFKEIDTITDTDHSIEVVRYQFCLYEAFDALRDLGYVVPETIPPQIVLPEQTNEI